MGSVSFREGNASGLLRSQGAHCPVPVVEKFEVAELPKTSSRPDIMENRTQV